MSGPHVLAGRSSNPIFVSRQSHYPCFSASFLIADFIDEAASSYPSQAVVLARSGGTVRMVKRFGSRSPFTCAQVSGIETVAPSRARGDNGATAVDIRSLRR